MGDEALARSRSRPFKSRRGSRFRLRRIELARRRNSHYVCLPMIGHQQEHSYVATLREACSDGADAMLLVFSSRGAVGLTLAHFVVPDAQIDLRYEAYGPAPVGSE